MAENIIGNRDGENGGNETYRIPGRGSAIPRPTLVREIEEGQHSGFHTVKIGGKKYARANPDGTKNNNIDR